MLAMAPWKGRVGGGLEAADFSHTTWASRGTESDQAQDPLDVEVPAVEHRGKGRGGVRRGRKEGRGREKMFVLVTVVTVATKVDRDRCRLAGLYRYISTFTRCDDVATGRLTAPLGRGGGRQGREGED